MPVITIDRKHLRTQYPCDESQLNGSRQMAGWAAGYGMSDWSVTLDEPRHAIVSEQHAYVVVPVAARWLEDGTPAERTGSLAVALTELALGWRVSALAWAWD